MRHLLVQDGPQAWDDPDEIARHEREQGDAVGMLVGLVSEAMLRRLADYGWKAESSTLLRTLNTLEALVADEDRTRLAEGARRTTTHEYITGLARTDMADGVMTTKEYIMEAKRCHDGLLARFGKGKGTVEEVLEQLYVSSVLEGLKAARPIWYDELKHCMITGANTIISPTRKEVTKWLVAKTKSHVAAAAAERLQNPSETEDRKSLASNGSADGMRIYGKGMKEKCSYCIAHHPRSAFHDRENCWFRSPDKAPPAWKKRFLEGGDSSRERREAKKERKSAVTKRSVSPRGRSRPRSGIVGSLF